MSGRPFDKGGYVPGPSARCRLLVREDGLVSFDGPEGPWSRVLTAQQIRDLPELELADDYERNEHV